MNPILATSFVDASVGWLLTYAIHSTILILGVWLAVRGIPPVARRVGPRGENLAWKFALVGALVSSTVQIGVGIQPALGAFDLGAEPEHAQVAEKRTRVEPAEAPRMGDEFIVVGQTSTPSEPDPVWPKLLFGLVVLGSLVALGRMSLSLVRLRARVDERIDVLDDPALEHFLTLCREARIERRVRLTHVASIDGPIALGRSEIVLPSRAIDDLSPQALRTVLAHELAHLERRDPAWLLVAGVIEALFFFQPLNRMARRGMQESAELLCDDWAIAHTGDGMVLAKSLAEVATWHREVPSPWLAGMVSGERPLVRRVQRALDGQARAPRDEGPQPIRVLFGLGALGLLISLAPGVATAGPPTKDEESATRSERLGVAKQAQERARAARDQADAAAAKAREAEAGKAQPFAPPPSAGTSITIRDGEDYLILDEKGVRAGSGNDGIAIEEDTIRLRIEGHDLAFPIEGLDALGLGDLGGLEGLLDPRAFEDFGTPGDPSQHPLFDSELGSELEGLEDGLDSLLREFDVPGGFGDPEEFLRMLEEPQNDPGTQTI